MAEHSIIMSAPMVRALLDGRKTQTRRVLKLPTSERVRSDMGGWAASSVGGDGAIYRDGSLAPERPCVWNQTTGTVVVPRYAPGDRLWVREVFAYLGSGKRGPVAYRADTPDGERVRVDAPWRPSIHMPRRASRLTLIVTDVRVQRLQDISEEDARAEGVERDTEPCDHTRLTCEQIGCLGPTHKSSFYDLWTSLHGPGAWDANPWVAALTFETHRRNIDLLPAVAA